MFFLGILVGRGTAPISFDTREFQKKLASIADKIEKKKGITQKPDLGFYSELKKSAQGNTTLSHSEEDTAFLYADATEEDSLLEEEGPPPEMKRSKKAITIKADHERQQVEAQAEKGTADEVLETTGSIKSLVPANPVTLAQPAAATLPTESGRTYTIQIAAFKDLNDALESMERLKTKGYTSYRTLGDSKGEIWVRVRTGAFTSLESAQIRLKKLQSDGINGIIIQKD